MQFSSHPARCSLAVWIGLFFGAIKPYDLKSGCALANAHHIQDPPLPFFFRAGPGRKATSFIQGTNGQPFFFNQRGDKRARFGSDQL